MKTDSKNSPAPSSYPALGGKEAPAAAFGRAAAGLPLLKSGRIVLPGAKARPRVTTAKRGRPASEGVALFRLRVDARDAEALLNLPLFMERFAAERDRHLAALRAAKREYVAAHRLHVVRSFHSMRALGWSLNQAAKVLGVAPSQLSTWVSRFEAVGINGLFPSALKVGRKRRHLVKPRRALNFLLTS